MNIDPKKILAAFPNGSIDAMRVFNDIRTSVDEYVLVIQNEATKRAEIRATADATIEHIHAQHDLLVSYLQLAHDERAKLFSGLFKSLDKAMEIGDAQIVGDLLGSITDIAKKSPFADLKDIAGIRDMWKDKDTEIEL